MDQFTQAYIEAALWSSTDDKGQPLDDDYDPDDMSPEALKQMQEDCQDFQQANEQDLGEIDDGQAGHDFWLTRNGHGAGFWDRGLGELGERLSKAAKVYGEVYLYPHESQIHHG